MYALRERRHWTHPLSISDVQTLRRLAVLANVATGSLLVAAPYLSTRPASERDVYAAIGAFVLAKGLLLTRARRWPRALVVGLAVWPDVLATLVLLTITTHVGVLPMLLMWPVLTSAYFCSRAAAGAVLAMIATGLGIAHVVSPDQRMSHLAWLLTVLVCLTCAATVRAVTERNDLLVRLLDDRANHDGITGLLNRRGFDDALASAWDAAWCQPLAVLLLDIDHFKAVNDTYGHATGDRVLARFADVLREHTGPTEIVGRTGGEEFAVAMPLRDGTEAARRALDIVDAVAAVEHSCAGVPFRVTVSVGVAERLPRHGSSSALCRDADRALYAAKDAGRNRAVLAAA